MCGAVGVVGRQDFAFGIVIDRRNHIIRFDDTRRFIIAGIFMPGMFVINDAILFATLRHEAKHTAVMVVMRNKCKRQQ
jgi:hypothetical protein